MKQIRLAVLIATIGSGGVQVFLAAQIDSAILLKLVVIGIVYLVIDAQLHGEGRS